jgi:hypothetical protein
MAQPEPTEEELETLFNKVFNYEAYCLVDESIVDDEDGLRTSITPLPRTVTFPTSNVRSTTGR